MTIKSSELTWIVVSDIKKAKKFFTEVLGLKLTSAQEDYGWLELEGKDGGAALGVASSCEHCPISPGGNGVVTFTVDNIEETKETLSKKGVKMLGEITEVPGHVKLQLFQDDDNNFFQLVQMLS